MSVINKEALRKAIREEYDRHKTMYKMYNHVERGGIVRGLGIASEIIDKMPEMPEAPESNCMDIDLGVKRLIRKCAATLVSSRTFLSENKMSDYRLALDLGVMYSLALGCFNVSVTLQDDCILFYHKQELVARCSMDEQELKFVNKR